MSADLIRKHAELLRVCLIFAMECRDAAIEREAADETVKRYEADADRIEKAIAEADAWLASGGKQEPVAYVLHKANHVGDPYFTLCFPEELDTMVNDHFDVHQKLYTHPAPQESGGWVPVSERLPDSDTWVLVAGRMDGPHDWRRDTAYRRRDLIGKPGRWVRNNSSWDITHWMPLPAPPKEGGKS